MDRRIEKRKWPPRRMALFGVCGLGAAAILWGFLVGGSGQTLRINGEHLRISTVERGPFQEFIPILGTIIPVRTHYMDATEGGRVEAVYREAGSFVEAGDKILKLANTNLLLDIMYREAELFQQSNNLRNTQITMEQNRLRMRRELLDITHQITVQQRTQDRCAVLVKDALVSQEEYEAARDELNYLVEKRALVMATQRQDSLFRAEQVLQLQGSLERMQSNLELVRQNMDNLVICAPVSGQLTALHAEIGQSKARGERLGQVDVLEGFKLRTSVSEHYITRVAEGQNANLTFDDLTYPLVIDKVYPEVIRGKFKLDLRFAETEPPGVRRGQTLHVRLELGDLTEALLLANGNFQQETGGRWVYLLDESGQTARRWEVSLGRHNTRFCEVLTGLAPGDRVITSSYERFNDADQLILKQ